jgi:hypothetical protein
LADLQPLPRGGANLLRAGYERPLDAGLTHRRVALRVARTEDRTRLGVLTDLAARPVVAAKLARVRVAVVVDVAGLVTRREADPRAARAAGTHGSGAVVVAAAARTPAGPRDGDADGERKPHTFAERRECHSREDSPVSKVNSRSPCAGPARFRPKPKPLHTSMNTLALQCRPDIDARAARQFSELLPQGASSRSFLYSGRLAPRTLTMGGAPLVAHDGGSAAPPKPPSRTRVTCELAHIGHLNLGLP